jgi:hypothetical protein
MNVEWHAFDYEDKASTKPPTDELVWIVNDLCEREVTIGFFDGFTMRVWHGSDDCDVTHWAAITYPEAPEEVAP